MWRRGRAAGSGASDRDAANIASPYPVHALEILLILGVLGSLLVLILFLVTPNVKPHRDEPLWLSNSYTLALLVQGRFSSPGWVESYEILRHPILTSYIIGIGQLAGGYNIAEFDALARKVVDPEDKTVLKGEVVRVLIDDRLLWWSRMPMAVLFLLCIVLLFMLVRATAGRAAAYAIVVLCMVSPYLLKTLIPAMSEGPLLLFLLLGTVCGERALRCWGSPARGTERERVRRSLLWLLLLGVCSGFATASKLNGATLTLGGIGLAVIIGVSRHAGSRGASLRFVLGAAGFVVLGQTLTFIALNPYLYSDIPQRLVGVVADRMNVIRSQQQVLDGAIRDLPTRLQVVPHRVFARYATLQFPGAWLLNGVLTALGLGYLGRAAVRWVRTGDGAPAAVALLASAVVGAGPPLLTPLDWDRYYLLPVVFSSICIAVGGAWSAAVLVATVKRIVWRPHRA